MKKIKLKVAIDSPAASGAGTQSKMISKHYNLFYLDTGKFYRILGKFYLKNYSKINYDLFKKKINNIKIKELNDKTLLSNKYGTAASVLAKDQKIRNIINKVQRKLAYHPPKKFNGSCLDGRDITYNIVPDADIKLYLTATLKVRALRRYKELKKLNHKISFKEVYKTIKKRDKNDRTRKIAPLKKIKGAILIDTSNLTIKECFNKISNIIDRKIKKQNHT